MGNREGAVPRRECPAVLRQHGPGEGLEDLLWEEVGCGVDGRGQWEGQVRTLPDRCRGGVGAARKMLWLLTGKGGL